MRRSKVAALIVSGFLLTSALTACGQESNKSSASNGAAAPAQGQKDAGAPAALAPGAGGAAAVPKTQPTLAPADVQRSIVYDGTITVRVKDVDVAAASAEALANGSGGYLGGDDRNIDASKSYATLTLRVPAGKFDTTMTALAALGTSQSRHISTQDVTGQVVDVQSRLKTQQASVDRIRSLIANTTSISQIVTLEDELTQRESDLESMEAQLRSLTDLTSLSTITVVLLGPDAKVVAKPAKKTTGFIGGLKSGWNGFVKSLTALLTVLGAVLPFVVTIGILAYIVWRLFYRRRRRSAPAPAAAPASEA